MEALRSHLGPGTRYVVELGTWLGKSARFILANAPRARLVCVDHWEGSPEIAKTHGYLFGERVYQAFLHHNWHLRDRIVPLRATTMEGIAELASVGFVADRVYVDAAHDAESVRKDVEMSVAAWPRAVFIGDDWEVSGDHYAVADGVADALDAAAFDYELRNNGKAWWARRTGDAR